ncbi:MAG TPA: FGGY family carbohydrate kinase, partial [Vicinamibacteria bacterium]|nr:FGGY family carbohydrate kinase [Vicinamibacteria bacterium]
MAHFLGYDLGSSSVKACLLDGESGRVAARASYPQDEMPIEAPRPGWAEQRPESWWDCVRQATTLLLARSTVTPRDILAVGISYQMHGLVIVDGNGRCLRPAIIWCDGRAVDIGERAFGILGRERCLEHLLNSPGNFTASKLRWVKEREPATFDRIAKVLLPGDYLAWKLTGRFATTVPGLSEGTLWDFRENCPARFLLDHFEIPGALLPDLVPTLGEQGRLTKGAAAELGLASGTPVTFRAGDQPTNALALNVLEPGEVAANAGTSGVVYGITDSLQADTLSRVNSFAHVNHGKDRTRLGVLLCINGAGSAYRWLRKLYSEPGYDRMNEEATEAFSDVRFYPFGNGPERMLENRGPGAWFEGIDFNTHGRAHLARAVLEGVAFSFRYGMRVLEGLGLEATVMRASLANMLKSAAFRETLANVTGVTIELYDTDGAEGAARGAAIGAGHYKSFEEALGPLARKGIVVPSRKSPGRLEEAYARWELGLGP